MVQRMPSKVSCISWSPFMVSQAIIAWHGRAVQQWPAFKSAALTCKPSHRRLPASVTNRLQRTPRPCRHVINHLAPSRGT